MIFILREEGEGHSFYMELCKLLQKQEFEEEEGLTISTNKKEWDRYFDKIPMIHIHQCSWEKHVKQRIQKVFENDHTV